MFKRLRRIYYNWGDKRPAYSCKECGKPCKPGRVGFRPLTESVGVERDCSCSGTIIAHMYAPLRGSALFGEKNP